MKYGYARVSTDGQRVTAQVAQLRTAGCGQVFREVASGTKSDRRALQRALDQLDAGDVLMVTRLDRLARSTRDLLNTLATITDRKAGFRSLGDAWADTTTPHGRLMLAVLGGLAEFERDLIRELGGQRAQVHPARRQHYGTQLRPGRSDWYRSDRHRARHPPGRARRRAAPVPSYRGEPPCAGKRAWPGAGRGGCTAAWDGPGHRRCEPWMPDHDRAPGDVAWFWSNTGPWSLIS
jgi:DNA invertase Pin-like site-specific DNA recombinase